MTKASFTDIFGADCTSKGGFCRPGKNRKSLISGGGGRCGSSKGGGGGDNGGGAGQSPYPLQAFCNSSISLLLETNFF